MDNFKNVVSGKTTYRGMVSATLEQLEGIYGNVRKVCGTTLFPLSLSWTETIGEIGDDIFTIDHFCKKAELIQSDDETIWGVFTEDLETYKHILNQVMLLEDEEELVA